MKRLLILAFSVFVYILAVSVTVQAQEDVRIKRNEFRVEKKKAGFKLAWKSVKKGDRLFDKGRGYYEKALSRFLEARKYNGDNAALNYKIGVCHLMIDDNEEAIQAFNKALASDEQVAVDVYFLLARAYHLNYEFDHAIENYQRCLEQDILEELEIDRESINVYIRQCNQGKKLVKNPVRVNINNMGSHINSAYDDYGPVFHGDSILYFTSRRKHEKNDDRWPGDNRFYSNIFRSNRQDGQWHRAQLVSGNIFSRHNNGIVEATVEPERIYVYLGHKDDGDIYYFEKKGKKWRGPKNFSNLINTNAKESSICLTDDGNTIYFVSTLPENNFGRKDIYFSKKNEKGKWMYPENVGGVINTALNEEGVFINGTGDKMYFSSEGHHSMGGYDVFVAEKDVDGNWQEPENMGYPINTPYDDVFFRTMEGEGNKAYYSTVKEDTHGERDLYEIIFLGEEREFGFSRALDPIAWEAKPDRDFLYVIPEELAIDTTIQLTGEIIDTAANSGMQAKLEIIDNDSNKIIATHLSDTNGRYLVSLPERKKYGVEITAKGYLFFARSINLNEMEVQNDTVYKDFIMDKVEIGKKVVLENIYFETNSATLKSSSYPELQRVVKLMKDNPGIKLEISGHTDNVGSYLTNKRLSENRAKSVVDYLVEQGLERSRLTYKGYSFTQPIASNDTPEGRQKNRRVEFKVLEK